MNVLISINQINNISKKLKLTEDINLNKDVDFSKVSSLDDLKNAVISTGLQHGEDTKTRNRSFELRKMLSAIDKLEDKEIFEKYFTKLSDLISTYKKGSFSLKKLSEIIIDLSEKDINVAKQQIEDIIRIFEDPRFEDKHKKKLISILTTRGSVDLDKFYEETKRAYADYENSFAEGPYSPFSIYRTSPRLTILLSQDFSYNNINFSSKEFNSQTSDISKVLYLIEMLSHLKIYGNVNDSIMRIISSLNFSFNFDYSPNNVKADLYLKESLIFDDRSNRPLQVAKKDTFIEVKYKPYMDASYLSEFFKVDASDVNYNLILNGLSKIKNVTDIKSTFIVFMSSLSENLKKTMESSEGNKIIDHLTNNLSGIIFKDNIFIPKKNIKFYWNSIGYAKRNRLSIWYKVENPDIYKISTMTGENNKSTFSRFVFKP
jgi:hypothetical protein